MKVTTHVGCLPADLPSIEGANAVHSSHLDVVGEMYVLKSWTMIEPMG